MWDNIGPTAITGYAGSGPDGGSGGLTTGVQASVTTPATVHAPAYSPDNPLFWFAIVLLAAGGFLVVSTHVHLGPVKGSATV
jgi:hypothetical protein